MYYLAGALLVGVAVIFLGELLLKLGLILVTGSAMYALGWLAWRKACGG